MTLRSLRYIALTGLIALGAITLNAGFNPAAAQTATPQPAAPTAIAIGVLDTDVLLNQSSAGKSVRAQVSQMQKSIQADIKKQEDALRGQMQQLDTQRASMPPQDYEAKRQAINAQGDKLRQDIASRRQAFNKSVEAARQKLIQGIEKVVKDVVQQRKLTLILNQSAVIKADPSWDITDEVMQRLNKSLPSIKM